MTFHPLFIVHALMLFNAVRSATIGYITHSWERHLRDWVWLKQGNRNYYDSLPDHFNHHFLCSNGLVFANTHSMDVGCKSSVWNILASADLERSCMKNSPPRSTMKSMSGLQQSTKTPSLPAEAMLWTDVKEMSLLRSICWWKTVMDGRLQTVRKNLQTAQLKDKLWEATPSE